MRESRRQVIADHVMLAISRSALTERTYAQCVADLYMERTPLHARAIPFAQSADPYADSEANRQTVKRMLDGRVRMAVDIEEALVLALPEPYRHALMAELAERLGLLAADQPAADATGQQHQVAELIAGAGAALDKLAPMLDDGVLDEHDAQYAAAALAALEALQARVVTIEAAIRSYAVPAASGRRARA